MNERHRLALDYLQAHRVLTLATVGAAGPWAAALFYVNDGFSFYFLSAGHTRHAQNLRHMAQAAATIQEDYADWPSIRGVQLEGVVRQLAGGEADRARSLYAAKYPFIENAAPAIRQGLARVNWYRLVANRLYFIDNSQGFGHRDEIMAG